MALVHAVAKADDVTALQGLLDEEPGLIEVENAEGWRPLQSACYAGSARAARYLLDRGAGIDASDQHGVTPLMLACKAGRPEVVSLLLAHGAQPPCRDEYLQTALFYASVGEDGGATDDWDKRLRGVVGPGHIAAIRLLLEDGRVPVDACDDQELTALWWACHRACTETARVLLLEGRASHTAGPIDMPAMEMCSEECSGLLVKYEGELEKVYLLTKALAVMDDVETIERAAEKAGATDDWQTQAARERAAPVYLKRRVEVWGEPLPLVEVVGLPDDGGGEDEEVGEQEVDEGEEDEEERSAVLEHLMMRLNRDLLVELMEGLRYRWRVRWRHEEVLRLEEEEEELDELIAAQQEEDEEEGQAEDDEEDDGEGGAPWWEKDEGEDDEEKEDEGEEEQEEEDWLG